MYYFNLAKKVLLMLSEKNISGHNKLLLMTSFNTTLVSSLYKILKFQAFMHASLSIFMNIAIEM